VPRHTLMEIESRQSELVSLLSDTESWYARVGELSRTPRGSALNFNVSGSDVEEITILRTRASRSLLTVAFLGEFSSGKSFLINALQGVLRYESVRTGGRLKKRYIGLLPSSTVPMTAHPSRIVPVSSTEGGPAPSEGRPLLKVRFADSPTWESKGYVSSPDLVAAYTTDREERVEGRLDGDRSRQVVEVEISLSKCEIPAELFDLPGLEAPLKVHEEVVNDRMRDADCFVYVSKATRTLSDSNVEHLLNGLHMHHKAFSRKPVIWVTTAIDLADNIDDQENREEWRLTVDEDNRYLRGRFTDSTGEPDWGFLGDAGFIGVSPALEAEGRALLETDPEASRELIAGSRMTELRKALQRLIEDHAGDRHLEAVAKEARNVLVRSCTYLNTLLESERLPAERIAGERADARRQIEELDARLPPFRKQLETSLSPRLERASATFKGRYGLSAYLEREMGEYIDSSNLRKEGEFRRLELRTKEVIARWIQGDHGPLVPWRREIAEFQAEATSRLGELLSDVTSFTPHREVDLDIAAFTMVRTSRKASSREDPVDKFTGLASNITSLAGLPTVVLGITTSTVALLPVGAALSFGGIFALWRKWREGKTALHLLREEERAQLRLIAVQVQDWVSGELKDSGAALIDAVMLIAERRRRAVNEHLTFLGLRERLPEAQEQRGFLAALEDLNTRADALLTGFGRFIA
jgi:Dynamin family